MTNQRIISALAILLFLIGLNVPGHSQEASAVKTAEQETAQKEVSEIPDEVKTALLQINQKSVKSTVTFLASDEMGGRDTPSPELKIASAYVASRFRGAGLVGGGDDDTFFQNTKIATVQAPFETIVISSAGKPVPHFGLYSSSKEGVTLAGKAELVDVQAPDEIGEVGEIVTVVEPDFKGDVQKQRLFDVVLNSLFRNGAKVVLLQVAKESRRLTVAKRNRTPQIIRTRGRRTRTILLVPKMDFTEEVKIEIPKQINGEASVRNVIGVLPGSDPELKKEAIIYSAHLDHIGRASGKDTVNNGADDNATGVTAVLTIADAMAALKTRPKRTTIFMTFWGEEKGLLGSRHYASKPTWPLENTVANVNIEMVGRPAGGAFEKCWMTGWNKSDLGEIMKKSSAKIGVEIFEHPQFSAMLYARSDNYSLAQKGVVAHSFSAGSLHADYHQPTDEWEKLEIRHMTRVIEGLFVGSLPIANGIETPKSKGK